MQGYLSLVLHAHLPFVRHPEHERFLEENWLFEAITETYLPLVRVIEGWAAQGMDAPLTLTLSPTLCAMLGDPLLQARYRRYLDELIDLSEKETHRTVWEKPLQGLSVLYLNRFRAAREQYDRCGGDLLAVFRRLQDEARIEIITCAATHALLPLLIEHPPSMRAQLQVARDQYRSCFGREPEGIWLPECAYVESLDPFLKEAGLRWFITESHGLLKARPRPRYGTFAPILTPDGLAVFARDMASAAQVWSRQQGYPGDPRYRDFYRDIGFDLDLDYLKPFQAAPGQRGFTGIKYYRITGPGAAKEPYQPENGSAAADEHAGHFLNERIKQVRELAQILPEPPVLVCPYDAELFGHWWYEGLEFLDLFARKAYYDQQVFTLTTPGKYLRQHPTHQVARPAASSWGEEGYWKVWLNETNQWIYPHLKAAQARMTELAHTPSPGEPGHEPGDWGLIERALKQAARELLLAQASDWPFILRTGTSPEYARKRVTEHLTRFGKLHEQIKASQVDGDWLAQLEAQDNLFPGIDYRYFR